jgi:hypothetical protein
VFFVHAQVINSIVSRNYIGQIQLTPDDERLAFFYLSAFSTPLIRAADSCPDGVLPVIVASWSEVGL